MQKLGETEKTGGILIKENYFCGKKVVATG